MSRPKFYTAFDVALLASDPSNPPTGFLAIYAKTDNKVYGRLPDGEILDLYLPGTGAANRVTWWSAARELDSDADFTYERTPGVLNIKKAISVSDYSPSTAPTEKPFFLGNVYDDVEEIWLNEFEPRQLQASDLVGGVGMDDLTGIGYWQIAHGGGFDPNQLMQSSDFVYKMDMLGVGTNDPVSKMDLSVTNLGTTQNNTSGFVLKSLSAATDGNQQISPALRFRGNGWKTDATAGSQPVDFRAYVLPIEGTSAPSGTLIFQSSINAGSYTNHLVVTSEGNIGVGVDAPLANIHIATSGFATLRLQRTATNGIFEIAQNNDVTSKMTATNTGSGNAIIDFDPIPSDEVSNALFRFFRGTNTTGLVALDILRGNNTASANARISGNGDSFINGVVGNVFIGSNGTPSSKLDVVGDVEIDSASAFYLGDPTTNDSWRIVRSGNNLVMQRRESSTWVTKQTISA